MSTSYATLIDGTKREEWTDVASNDGNVALASKDLTLQNVGQNSIRVFAGGASEPASRDDGIILEPGFALDVNAANIWVFAYKGYKVAALDNA